MKNSSAFLIVFLCLVFGSGITSVRAAEDPAHNELRALRSEVIDAITKGDIDAVVRHVHSNIVVTWQNNEVCRGQEGLRDFFHRMGKQTFKGYKVPPTPDELTILYGDDTGVSFGQTVAQYNLFGKMYDLKSRWTATVVKENGKWLLASYHISMNVLDNPLLNGAKQGLFWIGGVALAAGVVLGWLLRRPKRA
jgi:ketosteroid isomerase-like protein